MDSRLVAGDHPENDVFHINRYSIARYLFSKKKVNELNINLDGSQLNDYNGYLESPTTWLNYQNQIKKEIQQLQKEDSALHSMEPDPTDSFNLEDPALQKRIQRRIEIQQKLTQLYRDQRNVENIDNFIKNDNLLEKFLLQAEGEHHKHEEHEEHEHEEDDEIEELISYTEGSFETATNAIEVNDRVQEYTEQLNRITEKANVASEASSTGEHLSTAATTVKTIPLISDFIRGLSALREAYQAYKNPHTPERDTKIATGVFGGLVSIGVGIVGSLLLAGTGLLAGAAAVFAAPIVMGAAVVGVYATSLYRDHKVLQRATAELNEAEHCLKKLEKDFAHETENVLTRHIESLPLHEITDEVKAVIQKENDIKELVKQLHQAEKTHQPDTDIFRLKEKIHSAYQTRNNQIAQTKALKKSIIEKLQTNPRLARISLQRQKLSKSVQQLIIAKNEASKKRLFSAICMIGVGLALGAVFATGIGALVIAGVAAIALVGGTIARVIQTKQTANAIKQLETTTTPKQDHAHTSLYDIDYKLLHGKSEKIAGALIAQQQELHTSKSGPGPQVELATKKPDPVIDLKEFKEQKEQKEEKEEKEKSTDSDSDHRSLKM